MGKRLLIIGLDCADPGLLEGLLPELPTLRQLVGGGGFARLYPVDPPVTVPAWMCMFTGKDPGELGVYGFRNRRDFSYGDLGIASSADFRGRPVWEELGGMGLRPIVVGVPGTYPPRPFRGLLVSGILTPGPARGYTHPRGLKRRIEEAVGEYIFDVRDFRTDEKASVIREVWEMTRKRFDLMRTLLSREPWDLAIVVEIGPDRLQHAIWSHHDPGHPKHDPESPFGEAIKDYYRYLDSEIASLLGALPDDTEVLIVSDHGVQAMEGGIAVNEWLIREGYLVLHAYPDKPISVRQVIERGLVDWGRTVAWGEGGYFGRIFLNVEGREPEGIVPPTDYDAVRGEIAAKLESMPDEQGRPLGNEVLFPTEIYRRVEGIPPDIIVYFGGLRWRSIGSIGWKRIYFHENDTGPDDANHAPYGVLISSRPLERAEYWIPELRGMILEHFGVGDR